MYFPDETLVSLSGNPGAVHGIVRSVRRFESVPYSLSR